ncbi:MAG: helix-turn-helix domain-containing protein [Bacteroidales bacterium]|nr:helix-turn-helix domain-containing protein [Bacteroidales bacterium]
MLTQSDYLTTGRVATEMGIHPRTVIRWIREGCIAPGGQKVYLAARRIGGVYRVLPDAVEQFLVALNPATGGKPLIETPAERRKRARAAIAEFKRMRD